MVQGLNSNLEVLGVICIGLSHQISAGRMRPARHREL